MKLLERIRENRRIIGNLRSVKDALDTLPNAISYYDEYGRIKLYNRRMASLYYILAGEEVQDLAELKRGLKNLDENDSVKRLPESPNHYVFPDNTVWKYSESKIYMGEDIFYTEIIFSEETKLYEKSRELKNQAAELEKIARKLEQLSRDVLVMTKEEEVLAAKTRLHDEMGSALVAARQGFAHPEQPEISALAVEMLKKAVRAIKNDNEYESRRGSLAELLEDAATIGVTLRIFGEMPGIPAADEVFINAIRECMTNAVRHAGADTLYIEIKEKVINVTNNGRPPGKEIIPRGGLLNLKNRVLAMNGTMKIQWSPAFRLTVHLPEERG